MEAIEGGAAERRIRKVDRRFCPHCGKNVSYKTYKSHKRLYFNPTSSTWISRDGDRTSEEMNADSPPGSPGHVQLDPDVQEDEPPCTNYGELWQDCCNFNRSLNMGGAKQLFTYFMFRW